MKYWISGQDALPRVFRVDRITVATLLERGAERPDAEMVAPRDLRAELLERLCAMGPRLPSVPCE